MNFDKKKSAIFLGCHVIGLLKLCPIPAVTWSKAFSRTPYRFLIQLPLARQGSLKPEINAFQRNNVYLKSCFMTVRSILVTFVSTFCS